MTFAATAGVAYKIRVASFLNPAAFPFRLVVTPRFELKLSSPLGASSVKVEDLGGKAGRVYLNLFTLFPGTSRTAAGSASIRR